MPKYSSFLIGTFSSTKTLRTLKPFISVLNSFFAASAASLGDVEKCIPPAFPLPATRTCALTATEALILAAISRARAGEVTNSPRGVGILYLAKMVFASCSKSFKWSHRLFYGLNGDIRFRVLDALHEG